MILAYELAKNYNGKGKIWTIRILPRALKSKNEASCY